MTSSKFSSCGILKVLFPVAIEILTVTNKPDISETMIQYYYVTLSHLRSVELPRLHFVCSPASQATYEM